MLHLILKETFENGFPVSRSQAKKLCNEIKSYNEVAIDFSGIREIGQGFAHELFVVFLREYPSVKITIKNENLAIVKMINHVRQES